MNERSDGQMAEWTHHWMAGCVDGEVGGQVDEWGGGR